MDRTSETAACRALPSANRVSSPRRCIRHAQTTCAHSRARSSARKCHTSSDTPVSAHQDCSRSTPETRSTPTTHIQPETYPPQLPTAARHRGKDISPDHAGSPSAPSIVDDCPCESPRMSEGDVRSASDRYQDHCHRQVCSGTPPPPKRSSSLC